jgi:lipopolysaccharide export system protein LptA
MAKFAALLLSLLLCWPAFSSAQQSRNKKPVAIDFAQSWSYVQQQGKVLQKLTGEVQLHQDSVFMYCDSALIEDKQRVFASGNVIIQQADTAVIFADSLVYHGDTREAELFGNVILVNGPQQLFTNRLHYNLNTKVATYLDGAVLSNGQSRLSSKKGYYFVEQQEVFFRDQVEVSDPEFSLKSDTLKFNTASKTAFFLGPTIIATAETKVYTESGFYDTQTNFAEFNQNAQFTKGNQQATADTIRYDGRFNVYTLQGNAWFEEGERRATGNLIQHDQRANKTFLKGNAFLQDASQEINSEEIIYDGNTKTFSSRGRTQVSEAPQILAADQIDFNDSLGLGFAYGNIEWQDTSANLAIHCDTIAYNKSSGFLLATGGRNNRPLLMNILDGDTLFMSADTLLSKKLEADTSNSILLAYRDVRLLKSNLQAICDSLSYNSADSTFQFFKAPFIWTDTSQFKADTIFMTLRNNKINQILLRNNSFIINSPDEIFFNQIKGRNISASFSEEELREMQVAGNAESIYYARDEAGAYIGANKSASSDMWLSFGNNQIQRIKFISESNARMDPMKQVDHNTLRLDGFLWEDIKPCRPAILDDLFSPACPNRVIPTINSSSKPERAGDDNPLRNLERAGKEN